jgi:uncharacterized repeat protein (TIGR02543 family)
MKSKLIAAALITVLICVGLGNSIACGPTPTTEYDLTIDSTVGGSVTDPGEDTFTYDEGTVVNLVAEAEEGYQFVNWTGDVGTIAVINNTTTTIIMNDSYSITANFAFGPQYIPMVAAGRAHTVGLKSDGTVVAVGDNYSGGCDVGGWKDITQVVAGGLQTVGLKNNGTVVAAGPEVELAKWNLIEAVP